MNPNLPKITKALQLFRDIQPDNPEAISIFAKEFLGIDVPRHAGQHKWVVNSNRVINILKPANQWGKTLIESVKHLYHGLVRPRLYGRVNDPKVWASVRYETLNFGKTYEIARGVLETAVDIAESSFLLPSGETNHSLLEGWAIKRVIDAQNKPPEVIFYNESGRILIRSYDDLGSSFKRKRLPFVSGDEVGDIPELNLFVTGTLLPRLQFFKGTLDLVGTSQPQGVEYEELAQRAIQSMEEEKEQGVYSDYYFQQGSVYENPYLDPLYIQKIENVADPELRKQIIYGEYVDYAQHYFSYDEVANMFVDNIPYDPETGISEAPDKDGYYVFVGDYAAAKDETSLTCIRYNIKVEGPDKKVFYLPYRIVFHKAWVGETIPISSQYEMTRYNYNMYKSRATKCDFVYDAQSLGGKNVGEALEDLRGYPFPPTGMAPGQAKSEALGTLKEVISRGRKVTITAKGQRIDNVETWGFIKASDKIKPLRKQFEVYRLDDKKITQDRLMTVAMGVHFIEKRTPSMSHRGAVPLDLSKTIGKLIHYGR